MENFSLCSSARMMECLGHLSKEDLGPCHYHYPVHAQNCKISVEEVLHDPVAEELDWGWVTGGLLPHPMPGSFI